MATKTYCELLLDPRWQRKRLEVLQSAAWRCQECGASEKTLHVHHKQYFKGRAPWEYTRDELMALCNDCHEQNHEAMERLKIALAGMSPMWLPWVEGFAIGQAMSADMERRWAIRDEDVARGLSMAYLRISHVELYQMAQESGGTLSGLQIHDWAVARTKKD